jgi:ATP synthase I chain
VSNLASPLPPDSSPGAQTSSVGFQTERRIAWLTLFLGAAGAAPAVLMHRLSWAGGILIGSGLAWLNFRWLRHGLDGLIASSTAQAGAERPRVPFATYFFAMFRYALIGLAVYAIFIFLKVPLASMIVGLCALGAAALAASVYEILRPADG